MNAAMPQPESRRARIARDFGRAAEHYDQAARLQRGVADAALARLAPHEDGHVLDLGCGTGYCLSGLQVRCQPRTLTAVDLSPAMIDYARSHRAVAAQWLVADAQSVPLPSGQVDRLFSSLMVQWCQDLPAVLREIHRLLAEDGEAVVTTLVEGTLGELRDAWEAVDPGVPHVNRFLSLAQLRDTVHGVFPEAQIETEHRVLAYPDVMALLRELKTLGATHKDGGRRSATSPGRLRALRSAYQRWQQDDGTVPATYEVAYLSLRKS